MWNNMYEGVAALGRLKPTGLRHGGTHGTVLQRVPAPNSHLSRLNTKVTVPNQTSFLITAGLGIQERWLAASIYQSQLQAVQGSFLLLSQLPQPIHQWRCFLILPSMGLVLVVLGIVIYSSLPPQHLGKMRSLKWTNSLSRSHLSRMLCTSQRSRLSYPRSQCDPHSDRSVVTTGRKIT